LLTVDITGQTFLLFCSQPAFALWSCHSRCNKCDIFNVLFTIKLHYTQQIWYS